MEYRNMIYRKFIQVPRRYYISKPLLAIALTILIFYGVYIASLDVLQCAKLEFDNCNDSVHDFPIANCENIVRVGGFEKYIKNAPDKLYRIDGAWYVCFDCNFKLKVGKCIVISLGVSNDPTFDEAIDRDYKCNLHSFDPYIEAYIVEKARKEKPEFGETVMVPITDNWMFHKVGVVGYENKSTKYEKGGFISFSQMLKQLKLKNQVIDVLKMDIESSEWDFLKAMDMDYMCKYVKQFCFESHQQHPKHNEIDYHYVIIKKLEQCFSLFHRNHRFFEADSSGKTGHLSEWQSDLDYKLTISRFKDSVQIAKHMFIYGELYFLNRNFLN